MKNYVLYFTYYLIPFGKRKTDPTESNTDRHENTVSRLTIIRDGVGESESSHKTEPGIRHTVDYTMSLYKRFFLPFPL